METSTLRIAIGADHAGFELKEQVKKQLQQQGYELTDFGTHSSDSVDYPDYAHPTATAVESGAADLGVLICGSANGVCMAANKHAGIRAALCWLPEIAKLARQHNNANILCIPARYVEKEAALEMVQLFLTTDFEGGRHAKRVEKIDA